MNAIVQEPVALSSSNSKFGSGKDVRRLEDDLLLKGQGQFTDDVTLPGQAHLMFLRSPYPHARIVSIDTQAALAMPGVMNITTGADLVKAGVKPLPTVAGFPRADGSAAASAPRNGLAVDKVRFVGEPVAVVAQTLAQARNACEAIVIDYAELPMAVHMDDALAASAPLLCDTITNNIAAEMRHGSAEATDTAFKAARHIVKLDISNQRLSALALEPRSVLAYVDAASSRLTLRMSTQMPSGARDTISDALGIPKDQMRVVVGDVGGGFGMKTGAYPEDIVVAFCARACQRPVKWVAERGEEFLSAAHGRDVQTSAALALDESGKILALREIGRASCRERV